MSTRSLIGILKGNDVEFIYCHNDGYINGVGVTLQAYYDTKEKVEQLISLGDLSALGSQPISKPEYWEITKENLFADHTIAYKDRDEDWDDIKPKLIPRDNYNMRDLDYWQDYMYLFDPDNKMYKWWVWDGASFSPLWLVIPYNTKQQILKNKKS